MGMTVLVAVTLTKGEQVVFIKKPRARLRAPCLTCMSSCAPHVVAEETSPAWAGPGEGSVLILRYRGTN